MSKVLNLAHQDKKIKQTKNNNNIVGGQKHKLIDLIPWLTVSDPLWTSLAASINRRLDCVIGKRHFTRCIADKMWPQRTEHNALTFGVRRYCRSWLWEEGYQR